MVKMKMTESLLPLSAFTVVIFQVMTRERKGPCWPGGFYSIAHNDAALHPKLQVDLSQTA